MKIIDNENIAELEHDIWSRWMKYMFANWTPENVERWKRQMNTAYKDLPENEKESDRKLAVEIIQAIQPKLKYKMGYKIGLQKKELMGKPCYHVVLQNDHARKLYVHGSEITYGIIADNKMTNKQDAILLEYERMPIEKLIASLELLRGAFKNNDVHPSINCGGRECKKATEFQASGGAL